MRSEARRQFSTRARPGALAIGAALAALAAILLLASFGRSPQPAAAAGGSKAAAPAKPNIVVLLSDDQESRSMRVMKTVTKKLKRKGVTMKRFYDNFSLCCPARSTIFTGQYAHNHHVLSNAPPDGGYGVFNALHGDDYLPIWLQSAGYRTSYVGKYENGYAEPDEYGTVPTDVPKGWDDWHVLAPSRAQYFNYTLNQNGNLRQYTSAADDYSTDVFTRKAKRFIRSSARDRSPFYLELGYAAPHGGGGGDPGRSCNRAAVPAPEDLGALKGKFRNYLPASFNEVDVSDKPPTIAEKAYLTDAQVSDTLRKRRCAWESLLGVDRSVGDLVDEIQRDGIKRNTYVFFLSDNGFLRGEHRIRDNKRYLYEESARVPFVARGPGIPHGKSTEDPAVNADLTATVLQLSGATPGLTQDGQSLMPRLLDPAGESARAILFEAYAGEQILGVRTSRYLYTEWDGDAHPQDPVRELYDTYSDPGQLNNIAADPAYAGVVDELAAELDDLIECAGADCRAAPTGTLQMSNGGVGKNGCVLAPVTATLTSPDEAKIVSVQFAVDGSPAATLSAPPFVSPIAHQALRRALPGAATVTAKALFSDGRRLGLDTKLKACK